MVREMWPTCGSNANSLDLSVCILTHSQPMLLPECVAACVSEIDRAGLAAEIIVIDNASLDRYPENVVPLSPMIRIVRNEENLGFGAANNRAIRMSFGRLVLILNDDAILQEGSLGVMVSALRSNPGAAVVGPRLYNPDGSLQRGFMNRRFPHLSGAVCEVLALGGPVSARLVTLCERNPWTRRRLTMWDDPRKSDEPDQVAGACLLARRQVLDEVGLFDEGFYYVLEDADLCYRVRKAGWRILCVGGARVVHFGRATYDQWNSSAQTANYLRSINYFLKKHSSPAGYCVSQLVLGLTLLFGAVERTVRVVLRRGVGYRGLRNKARDKFRLLRSVVSGK
jgi:GT2 family glycosyltransferase